MNVCIPVELKHTTTSHHQQNNFQTPRAQIDIPTYYPTNYQKTPLNN